MNNTAILFWNDYDYMADCLRKKELSSCIVEYKSYKVFEREEQYIHYYYLLTEGGVVVDISVDHDGNTTVFEVYDNLHSKTINSFFGANIASKLGA